MEYEKCLVQIDNILSHLSEENLEKIPLELREAIKKEKDKNYEWAYDEGKSLSEQNIDRETISMLSYLNMEYLLNEKQKEFIQKLHEFNEKKSEEAKKEKYNYDDMFKTKKINNEPSKVMLVEVKKEKWYRKIFTFFKKIFKRT